MANQYYYTVTSLPMLSYELDKFMSEEEFFDCCGSIITEKDLKILKSAKTIPLEEAKSSNAVLEKWNSWERALRNELVRMRAGKKGVDSEKFVAAGSTDTGVAEIARDAFNAATPLDAELVLNKARWEYLELLEAGHYFDLGKLIIYFLKLQLLNRKAQINAEKGKAAFGEVYTAIAKKSDEQGS